MLKYNNRALEKRPVQGVPPPRIRRVLQFESGYIFTAQKVSIMKYIY